MGSSEFVWKEEYPISPNSVVLSHRKAAASSIASLITADQYSPNDHDMRRKHVYLKRDITILTGNDINRP